MILAGRSGWRAPARGQAVVEFALVLPILMVLALAIGDFGRVFSFAVNLEGGARDAAEAVSNAYLANPPGPLTAPAPAADANYYAGLRLVGARAACADSRNLPDVILDAVTATCPGMPLVLVCVHDGQDPGCGTEANGQTVPAECTELTSPPFNAQSDGTHRYVEVRLCYRFRPLMMVPLSSAGTIWLQRARVYDIPCYFSIGAQECG